ncbi:MAG: hypothetical protein HRU41_05065 [Saprospiraceae bacterium]|nr:hypothetical protein [Saprospiraceae bacterium]
MKLYLLAFLLSILLVSIILGFTVVFYDEVLIQKQNTEYFFLFALLLSPFVWFMLKKATYRTGSSREKYRH